jgi:hypothetical protein
MKRKEKTHEKCNHVFCFYLDQILHKLLPKIRWSHCSIISFSLLSLGVNNESVLWPLKSSSTLTLMFKILNIKFAYSLLDKSSHFEHHFHASCRVANLPMIFFVLYLKKECLITMVFTFLWWSLPFYDDLFQGSAMF